ncbi:hypothetical protein M426DRAFT_17253 [Hypoxylon sp. CI-4A]|nr:hypothetical protein M426DRAFT_17253 [Hypoxylon sp. CI-4A]
MSDVGGSLQLFDNETSARARAVAEEKLASSAEHVRKLWTYKIRSACKDLEGFKKTEAELLKFVESRALPEDISGFKDAATELFSSLFSTWDVLSSLSTRKRSSRGDQDLPTSTALGSTENGKPREPPADGPTRKDKGKKRQDAPTDVSEHPSRMKPRDEKGRWLQEGCNSCKEGRRRCNRGNPCTACTRSGAECKYPDAQQSSTTTRTTDQRPSAGTIVVQHETIEPDEMPHQSRPGKRPIVDDDTDPEDLIPPSKIARTTASTAQHQTMLDSYMYITGCIP